MQDRVKHVVVELVEVLRLDLFPHLHFQLRYPGAVALQTATSLVRLQNGARRAVACRRGLAAQQTTALAGRQNAFEVDTNDAPGSVVLQDLRSHSPRPAASDPRFWTLADVRNDEYRPGRKGDISQDILAREAQAENVSGRLGSTLEYQLWHHADTALEIGSK